MKQVCLNSNVVIVFDRNIYDDFAISDLEDKVKDTLGTEVQTGSTNIPNQVKAVFSTTHDLQIVGQNKTLVIATTKMNESNLIDGDFTKISYVVYEYFKKLPLKPKFYGFNHTFTFLDDDFENIKNKIQAKYIGTTETPKGYQSSFTLPIISFIKANCRYTLAYGVEYSEEDNQPSKINTVASFTPTDSRSIPATTEKFKGDYSRIYKEIYNLLDLSE
jgi:hypothetical protein